LIPASFVGFPSAAVSTAATVDVGYIAGHSPIPLATSLSVDRSEGNIWPKTLLVTLIFPRHHAPYFW